MPRLKRPPIPDDELRERFEMNLRACRKRLGVRQEELGFRAGIHPRSTGSFEQGRVIPKISTFIRLAGSLGVRPTELVAGI